MTQMKLIPNKVTFTNLGQQEMTKDLFENDRDKKIIFRRDVASELKKF